MLNRASANPSRLPQPIVLVVEDEAAVSSFIERSLAESGLRSEIASSIASAETAWRREDPDLVLLDLMLPDGNGLDLLRRMREEGQNHPVIVLSARAEVSDRVIGLDLGADDYLTKPFNIDELHARIRARIRRDRTGVSVIRCGDLVLDTRFRRASRGGRNLFLSTTEFDLLQFLAANIGKPITKQEILAHVWDDPVRHPNLVEVYVNYLRTKLERGGRPRLIHTARGAGYVLDEKPHDR